MQTDQFIADYHEADIHDVALRVRQYPEVDAAFALQQIEGWQRGRLKLPTLAAVPGWQWPVRLSLEQCSSEETARYKKRLLPPDLTHGADLTGGFGIDTFFLSEGMKEWHYVERNADLCRIAAHNFAAAGRMNIEVYNQEAEEWLEGNQKLPCPSWGKGGDKGALYADPARRGEGGGKVFRLEECTPDLTQLYDRLMASCRVLLVKLSPMLDISEALRHLKDVREVHVVSVKGEVKELLMKCERGEGLTVTAALLPGEQRFSFTLGEEQSAQCQFMAEDEVPAYLYEPDAAVLKAGAFRCVAARFGLRKLAPNTHIYASNELVKDFPGRVFQVLQVVDKQSQKALRGTYANIITRNYPLRPEELKKKLQTRDGGEHYLIGARVGEKPRILLCKIKL